MKTTQTLQPKLRFPEFEGNANWSEETLGTLFKHRQERALENLPLLSLTAEKGIIPQAESGRKDNSNLDKSRYLKVTKGDIAYNTMRMWEGRSTLSNLEGLVSPAYTICAPQKETDSVFFSYYIKTQFLIEQFYRNSQGLTKDTFSLKYPSFAKIKVLRPTKREQQKIADCLGSLDELLTAHRSKLTALQDHKKGLLQQLFPTEGQTTPNLRFPEFENAGDWITTEIKDVFSIFQGYAFSSNDSCNSGARWLKIADVGIQKMNPSSPSFLPEGHTKEHSRFIVSAEDLVVALTRPFLDHELKIAKVDSIYDGALLNQRVGKILPKEKSDFVYYILQTSRLTSAIEKQISGNDPPNLSSYQIEDIETLIPKPNEQQKIADSLSDLDDLITAETQSIEALKTHKKGLMQNLFPNPDLSKS